MGVMRFCFLWVFLVLGFMGINAYGQEEKKEAAEVIEIKRDRVKANQLLPALQNIDSDAIRRVGSSNPEEVLQQAPGIIVQGEDGYGLRPNIGMRGVHPHRSKKIILLEDGVPVAPAPYSAPAAYYFPHIKRLESIDVIKGPKTLAFGPNNIGGAIHMMTPKHGWSKLYKLDLSYGSHQFHQLSGLAADSYGPYSAIFGATRTGSAGFKSLPSGKHTGFTKNDFFHKGAIEWQKGGSRYEWFYKVSYASEDSNETYLGLNMDSFKEDPYQRYAASQRDRMTFEHGSFSTGLLVETAMGHVIEASFYQNEFTRNWLKFDGFVGGNDVKDLLSGTGKNSPYLRVLQGLRDSSNQDDSDQLILGENDRSYLSKGLNVRTNWMLPDAFGASQTLNAHLRVHQDSVERDHKREDYRMAQGELVAAGRPAVSTVKNRDRSYATSLYLAQEMEWDYLTLVPAVRLEKITGESLDKLDRGPAKERQDSFTVLALDAAYEVSESFNLEAGVYEGYTVVTPGQDDGIKPEESLNFQFGFQWGGEKKYLNMLSFYHDYKNIKGTCTASSGCSQANIDKESNGGAALVTGLETQLGWYVKVGDYGIPLRLSHTYTSGTFKQQTQSDNPEWGIGTIESGARLPYLPEHQGFLEAGVERGLWLVSLRLKYQGERMDQAVAIGREQLPAWSILNLGVDWQPSSGLFVNLRVTNLLDKEYISSMRPFGYRPGPPRTAIMGVSQTF